MARFIIGVALGLILTVHPALAAEGKYSIKSANTAPPKELSEPVAKLLSQESVQLVDAKGELLAELWLRKEVPAKGGDAKKGLTYRDLEETTLLGAVRFPKPWTDYRKQKIKPGVYTLRLGFQPMDGDHMGTAPYPEFCLLSPAAEDKKPDAMDAKALHEMSAKASMATHPAVMLLYPTDQPKEKAELAAKENDTWVVNLKAGALGLGLTLVGHSTAE
jgi:hypothetical protein